MTRRLYRTRKGMFLRRVLQRFNTLTDQWVDCDGNDGESQFVAIDPDTLDALERDAALYRQQHATRSNASKTGWQNRRAKE